MILPQNCNCLRGMDTQPGLSSTIQPSICAVRHSSRRLRWERLMFNHILHILILPNANQSWVRYAQGQTSEINWMLRPSFCEDHLLPWQIECARVQLSHSFHRYPKAGHWWHGCGCQWQLSGTLAPWIGHPRRRAQENPSLPSMYCSIAKGLQEADGSSQWCGEIGPPLPQHHKNHAKAMRLHRVQCFGFSVRQKSSHLCRSTGESKTLQGAKSSTWSLLR